MPATQNQISVLSDGREISLEILINEENMRKEVADFYDWDLSFAYFEAYEEFFWSFAASLNFSPDSVEEFNKYRYSQEPLRILHDGRKIEDKIILNEYQVQIELCHFYGWIDDFASCHIIDEEAFVQYCVDLHHTHFNDETFLDFREAYIGLYESEENFAQEYVTDLDELPEDVPSYILNNIDWEGVAEEFRISGDVFYRKTKNGFHVYRSL